MDATQKRRLRKVVIIHFCLTLFFILLIVFWAGGLGATKGGPFNPDLTERHIRHAIWGGFWFDILKILQPLPFLIFLIFQQMVVHSLMPQHPLWLVVLIFLWCFVNRKFVLEHLLRLVFHQAGQLAEPFSRSR